MMTFNHGLSGYVCGQVAMPVLRRHAPVPERALGWAFFLGAMAPDLDILTRALVGRGAYFSGAWYGHRSASHSLLGTLVLAGVVAAVLYGPLVLRAAAGEGRTPRHLTAWAWLVACAWVGGMLHIFGDLFTPRWPVPVLWPLEARWGAWSHIGWFSPYLLWTFVTAIALGTLALRVRPWLERRPGPAGGGAWARLARWAPAAAWGVYALTAYRWVDYLAGSRYEHSSQWTAYQHSLLPEAMITPIARSVHTLWRWFTG